MADIQNLTKNLILFSYQSAPMLAVEGCDGGFAITVYGDGEVRYRKYSGMDEIELLEVFHLSRKALKIFLHKIRKIEERLQNVPLCLDNGSEGGVIQKFTFHGGKTVSVKNLKKTSLKQAFLFEHSNYKKYRENMKHENLLMESFEEIRSELEKSGIELDETGCRAKKSCRLRISWCELEKKTSKCQDAELNCL